MKKTHCSITLC
ncbi:hypothetical protein SEETMRM10961_4000 [Salmonella enterica subsp. enterica serovar Typhimurium]|nr:hypothetical protein SEETMRM10961_4000 [Salmonella enterica subsp. enterica serovar Typhimurium]